MVRESAPWILSEEKDGIERSIGIKERPGIGAGIRIKDLQRVRQGACIVEKGFGEILIGASLTVGI